MASVAATGDNYDGTRNSVHGGIPKLRNREQGLASGGLQQLDIRPRQPQAPLPHEKRGLCVFVFPFRSKNMKMLRRTALDKEDHVASPAEKTQRRCSPTRLPLLRSDDGPSEESRCTSLTMKQTSSYATASAPGATT